MNLENLKPGLVASYDQSGNIEGIFWKVRDRLRK